MQCHVTGAKGKLGEEWEGQTRQRSKSMNRL